jgi:hypothetical protein
MISFSPGSISLRALLATVAVVGAATFVAGRASQSAAFVISPFTVCSEAIAAAFPVEAPYLTENDAAMKQAPQAITYVPNAVPEGDGTQGLQQLDIAGRATHLDLGTLEDRKTVGSAGNASSKDKAPTSVSLFGSGADTGISGICHRPAAEDALRAGAFERTHRQRKAGSDCVLHDQSGGFGDRKYRRADQADRARRTADSAALSGDRGRPSGKTGPIVQVQLK